MVRVDSIEAVLITNLLTKLIKGNTMYLQNEKTLQIMIDIAEMLNTNPNAKIVLFKDYFSKSAGAMFITMETYNVSVIDDFIGRTHRGYGVVSPTVEDYSGQEVSIENGELIIHTISDKLIEECKHEGRYLILNYHTNTYVDVTMDSYRAIEATLRYSSYKFEDIMEGNPSDLVIKQLASDVTYDIELEETYPDDPGCGIYTMVVDYTTPSI